jgi:biofilm PGA synthesis N-glycosyltransferase PgaC
MNFNTVADFLLAFAYYYPLFMSYLWMCGGLYYRVHWENVGGKNYEQPPELDHYPGVSVLIPCYNEEKHIEETIRYIFQQRYPDYEVLAINDGSTDKTSELLNNLQAEYPNLKVIHLEQNSGKAAALRTGALLSRHEILVCIDSDAILDENATTWLVSHFVNSPRVAAVTGNPRIRNRSTLLGKIQVGEFSSIIGLIKRAQRIYGRIFTVSGVVTAFRKSALQRVGFWSTDIITEDIDVSWRLQLDHSDIRYEPNALCWILVPETYTGLWKQRLRWAHGGAETIMRYSKNLFDWKSRRMWGVFAEYVFSVLWSYVLVAILVLWLVGKFYTLPDQLYVPTIIPGWHGVMLGTTCLLQFFVSLMIDCRYEKGLLIRFFWMVWYPLAYWLINVLTIAVAFPTAVFKGRGKTGLWTSPDRGRQKA